MISVSCTVYSSSPVSSKSNMPSSSLSYNAIIADGDENSPDNVACSKDIGGLNLGSVAHAASTR